MYEIENDIIKDGYEYLIGIDEVGRGPLAGPVVSVAVGLKSSKFHEIVEQFDSKIGDSKKLSLSDREEAYKEIKEEMQLGIGLCSAGTIDEINILEATKLSICRSVNCLSSVELAVDGLYSCILLDGKMDIDLWLPYLKIPQGDSKCFLISCASIVAKIVRDEIMMAYESLYPEYGFANHKGYGTKEHRKNIKKFGVSPIHRKTFSPCKAALKNG